MNPNDFGWALGCLRAGYRLTREGWNGRGMWIALQRPDAGSKMTQPYLYMKTATGGLVPWLASQADLLSEDWRIIDGQGQTMARVPGEDPVPE